MLIKNSLGCAIILGWLLTPSPIVAQSQTDADKIELLQRQTELLEKQLKALQQELKQTKKRTEKVEAAVAVEAPFQTVVAPSYTPSFYETKSAAGKLLPSVAGVKVTLGGY